MASKLTTKKIRYVIMGSKKEETVTNIEKEWTLGKGSQGKDHQKESKHGRLGVLMNSKHIVSRKSKIRMYIERS